MELRRVVWTWEVAIERFLEHDASIGEALRRSCRPIAAEREAEGRLVLALGCWWAADLAMLGDEVTRARLDAGLSAFLDDPVHTEIVAWPGGMSSTVLPTGEVLAPDILAGLPLEARDEAARCESALQRHFYARAFARGLRLRCQHRVSVYRLDFALPRERLGVEIQGWWWRGGGMGGVQRERELALGGEGWRVLAFAGVEVARDVDRCVERLAREYRQQRQGGSGGGARSRRP